MRIKFLTIIAAAAILVSACNSGTKSKEDTKEISIAFVDGWAEGVAMTNVANEILIQNGYKVNVKQAAVDLIFASLANGDLDVFMDVWLPITHNDKILKFKGKIESLGNNYDNAKIGLVVPKYVSINSIEELNANADKFDGKIIGIEKGAGITGKTEKAIVDYNLKLEQLNSSGVAMLSELQKAISENKWIVVTGWAPHWKFARFELKFLDDPLKVYGETERIETYCRKGFKTDDAFATKFFTNFHLDETQMADLLSKMEAKGDKSTIAKQWIKDNKALVDAWLK